MGQSASHTQTVKIAVSCLGTCDSQDSIPPPPPLIDIQHHHLARETEQDLPLKAQFNLQQQRGGVEQVRQLLRREENRLSDMLEQVTRYRVERFRREQMERIKSFPQEIQ